MPTTTEKKINRCTSIVDVIHTNWINLTTYTYIISAYIKIFMNTKCLNMDYETKNTISALSPHLCRLQNALKLSNKRVIWEVASPFVLSKAKIRFFWHFFKWSSPEWVRRRNKKMCAIFPFLEYYEVLELYYVSIFFIFRWWTIFITTHLS